MQNILKNKKLVIGLVIFVLLTGFSGWLIYRDFKKFAESPKVGPLENNQISPKVGPLEEEQQTAALKKEEEIKKQMPDLDRSVNIPENLTEDVKKIVQDKITNLVADLKKEPNLFSSWLQLAIYRKMIDDYEGAREIWDYTSKIMPNDPVSFNNLADLYAYFLKDNKKAEENFLKALEKGPDQIYIYRSVYEFYRYVMKDDAKAKDILQKGIKLNLDISKDLKYLLDNY